MKIKVLESKRKKEIKQKESRARDFKPGISGSTEKSHDLPVPLDRTFIMLRAIEHVLQESRGQSSSKGSPSSRDLGPLKAV